MLLDNWNENADFPCSQDKTPDKELFVQALYLAPLQTELFYHFKAGNPKIPQFRFGMTKAPVPARVNDTIKNQNF